MLNGNELDLYTRIYTDQIEMELQQEGSVLSNLVTIEPGVMGERTYFNRMGAVDGVTEHTTRFEKIDYAEATFERRLVTPKLIDKGIHVDKFDLIRMSREPTSEIAAAIANGMGRQVDAMVIDALGGSAGREVGGSASNASFDSSNQQVAVNGNGNASADNTGAAPTGNTMLHEGKILTALNILKSNYLDLSRNDVVVIGSAKQLTALRTRMNSLGWARKDFTGREPLNVPGADTALDGILGCTFVHYEHLADSSQLSGSDEYVYVFPKSAVRLGVWRPLEVRVRENETERGIPIEVYAMETLGAVRMDEKKVVRILCATS